MRCGSQSRRSVHLTWISFTFGWREKGNFSYLISDLLFPAAFPDGGDNPIRTTRNETLSGEGSADEKPQRFRQWFVTMARGHDYVIAGKLRISFFREFVKNILQAFAIWPPRTKMG